jgi:hypothetical protein
MNDQPIFDHEKLDVYQVELSFIAGAGSGSPRPSCSSSSSSSDTDEVEAMDNQKKINWCPFRTNPKIGPSK